MQKIVSDLNRVIEQAYTVFGHYQLASPLNVCHCNVCLDEEEARELLRSPLRSIPSRLLGAYTDSVSAGYDASRQDELRHFLPRYFELIAANDPPDPMGLEICLRRLREFEWRQTWPKAEVETIDAFFDAYVAAAVQNIALWTAPSLTLRLDFTEVLTMIVTARGDIARVLQVWDNAPDPFAIIHMAALRGSVVPDPVRLTDAHLSEEFDAEAQCIGAFLARPEIDARLEAAFFNLTDPRYQKILSDADWRVL